MSEGAQGDRYGMTLSGEGATDTREATIKAALYSFPAYHPAYAALDALVAERDRYREALERIAAHPHGGILVNIARAALAEDSGRG